jgi:putative oxidoreductase
MIDTLLARVLAPAPPAASLAATALRLGADAIFIGFGQSKFAHHAHETAAFRRYGLLDPGVFAYLIGTLELTCGLLLVLGLATRLVAAQIGEQPHLLSAATGAVLIATAVLSVLSIRSSRSAC